MLLATIILSIFFSTCAIYGAEARCIESYPCRGPTERPLSVDYWRYSDTVIQGKVVAKLYSSNAFDNFDHSDYKNPCHLDDQSKYLEPFKIRLQVEKIYKGMVFFKYLDIYGTDLVDGQQFSKGYMINPDLGETVLLYLNYHESIPFGDCNLKNIYKVNPTQGAIWGWNFDDYKPDIYPGDVVIHPFDEQLLHFDIRNYSSTAVHTGKYERLVCPLGEELMFKADNPNGIPYCVHYEDAPRLEQVDFAYRVHEWNSWNKFDEASYDETKEYPHIKPFNFDKDHMLKFDSYPVNEKLQKIFSKITTTSDETENNFKKMNYVNITKNHYTEKSVILNTDGSIYVPLDYYTSNRFFISNIFGDEKILNGLENYFPKYIPINYELKFVRYSASYQNTDAVIVYAPFSLDINTTQTISQIMDDGGIIVIIETNSEYPGYINSSKNPFEEILSKIPSEYGVSGWYSQNFPVLNKLHSLLEVKNNQYPSTVYVELPNNILVSIGSFDVDIEELFKMANENNDLSFTVSLEEKISIQDDIKKDKKNSIKHDVVLNEMISLQQNSLFLFF